VQNKAAHRILFISKARVAIALRRSMNARGFAVTFEPSSQEGFDQLSRSSFDVIVLDLNSTADANEFIKQVRKVTTFKAIPVVVVGQWGTGKPLLALSAGANAFEPAPLDAGRLIDSIARLPKKRAAAAAAARTK
jgi:DNA-binding NtrC family response regulator